MILCLLRAFWATFDRILRAFTYNPFASPITYHPIRLFIGSEHFEALLTAWCFWSPKPSLRAADFQNQGIPTIKETYIVSPSFEVLGNKKKTWTNSIKSFFLDFLIFQKTTKDRHFKNTIIYNMCHPGPSKGCLLEVFKYLKTTNKHPLEGAGCSFHIFLFVIPNRSPLPFTRHLRVGDLFPQEDAAGQVLSFDAGDLDFWVWKIFLCFCFVGVVVVVVVVVVSLDLKIFINI